VFYNDSFPCQPGFIRLCYFSFVRGVTVNHVESRSLVTGSRNVHFVLIFFGCVNDVNSDC